MPKIFRCKGWIEAAGVAAFEKSQGESAEKNEN